MSEVLKAENSGESKIPIFKVLRMYINSKELAAYYRGNKYVLNEEYSASILPFFRDRYFEINEGLHCYSVSCKFNSFEDVIMVLNNDCRACTYNSGQSMRFNGIQPYKPVVVKGYIPPNTIYYINDDNEIVTQRLVLTSILE